MYGERNKMEDKKTRKEFKKVKELVEELLRTDDRCRNDDKWLTYQVMRYFTNIYIPFEDFNKLPAFETVKRVRATIQNTENRFLPTDPDVFKKRYVRAQTVRNIIGKLR